MQWLGRWEVKLEWIKRPLKLVVAYLLYLVVFRLISTTLVTYFLASATTRIQEISETLAVNEVPIFGIAAFLFTLLLYGFRPWSTATKADFFDQQPSTHDLWTGFAQGSLLAIGFVGSLWIAGFYRYLGSFLQFGESGIAFGNIGLRILTVLLMVFAEEYIFRKKILDWVRPYLSDTQAAVVISLAYCLVKTYQFEFGLAHFATLFLISCRLTLQSYHSRHWREGAAYWASALVCFHGVFGLPVFGNEFQGAILMKYLGDGKANAWVTGGIGGPLSSFLIQVLTLVQILRVVTPRLQFSFKK